MTEYELVALCRSWCKNVYKMIMNQHGTCEGHCDAAVRMWMHGVTGVIKSIQEPIPQFSMYEVHGEQRHTPDIPSTEWMMEHTWGVLEVGKVKYYADPTARQFKYLYPDIPNWYFGKEPPRWYYPDCKNPCWMRSTRWLNVIRIPERLNGKWRMTRFWLFIQYTVWAKISDWKRMRRQKKLAQRAISMNKPKD